MGESTLDTAGVDGVGFLEVGEAGFHGESVGVQPVQERGFAEDSGIRELRGMDMCI